LNYQAIQEYVSPADPEAPGRKHLVRKSDFELRNAPLTENRIGLGQKNHMKINFGIRSETIEQRDPVWRDDLGNDHKPAAQPTHSS
jgi:hypothetical protein